MYDQISRFYDLTHDRLTADIPAVLELARQTGRPVLEPGCGSGRLLLPLAQAGFAVTGFDNSAAMLERARSRLAGQPAAVQRRVQLLSGDMAHFELPPDTPPFGLALFSYNTLMHLQPEQMLSAFKLIGRHLARDGRLFIDVINPFLVDQTPNDRFLTLEDRFEDPETGQMVLQMAGNWLDQANQTLEITWIYDASPPAGGAVERTVAHFTYHYLFPHQLEMLLGEAGFRQVSLAGDYEKGPFGEHSERLLVVAAPAG